MNTNTQPIVPGAKAPVKFDGKTYNATLDKVRLSGALEKVYRAAKDGTWHTLEHLSWVAGCTESSASARLRDLRKPRFGSHTVNRRRTAKPGIYEYQLIVNPRA